MSLPVGTNDMVDKALTHGIVVLLGKGKKMSAISLGTVTHRLESFAVDGKIEPHYSTYHLCLVPEGLVDDGSG